MTAVMMVLMVEMMLMMITMILGVMAMTMAVIPPPLREGNSPADFSLPELFFSLSGFRLVEAAEKLMVDTPNVFRSIGGNTPKGARGGPQGPGAGPTRG